MSKLRLIIRPLRHYGDFAGQSSLKEFWLFSLLTLLIGIAIVIGDDLARSITTIHEPVSLIATGLLWIPNCALCVRRLHSRGHSGWWLITIFGFALIALLTNQLVGHYSWGRYATSFWTILTAVNVIVVGAVVSLLPARNEYS